MIRQTFTSADVQRFATTSGDHNPVHVDPVAARRTLFGGPVVHGVYVMLRALEALEPARVAGRTLESLSATFRHSVSVGDDVEVICSWRSDDSFQLRVETNGKLATTARGILCDPTAVPVIDIPDQNPAANAPVDRTLEEMEGASGRVDLALSRDAAHSLFPRTLELLAPAQLAAVLATTRVVGMDYPGLHSMYAAVKLDFTREFASAPQLTYTVVATDERFSRIELELNGPGVHAVSSAFVRPASSQPGCADLAKLVTPGEFRDQRALVVGGSRGIGEVIAKLLACGGAAVELTYHRGHEDALEVVRDIEQHGGTARARQADVVGGSIVPTAVAGTESGPTHVYYLASPHIGSGEAKGFDTAAFQRFCDYYCTGLIRTVEAVLDASDGPVQLFHPSTVFVESRPADMAEYAAAKAAAETLCGVLERRYKRFRVHNVRIPRVATDQTQSLMPTEREDPAPRMLKELRDMDRDQAST